MSDELKSKSGIRERTFKYSLRAIRLYKFLLAGKDGAGRIIGKQYMRSATSIGANIEEAQSAVSKPDFILKLSIAQKEARESLYWLRLLHESEIVSPKKLDPLLRETEEIVASISRIIITARKNQKKKRVQTGV